MNQNEPIAASRVVPGRLFDAANNPLALNTVFTAGDLKIVQPDGTIANAAHLPTALAGALPGSFNIQLDVAEISQVGNVRLQLNKPGVVAIWEWVETITPSIWQVIRAGNQPVGSFGEILDERISAIVAQTVAPVAAPTKPYSVIQGDLEPDMEIDVVDLDGTPVNLSAATLVQLRWSKPGTSAIVVALTAIGLVTGRMKRVWAAGDTDITGRHRGQVVSTASNGETTTYPRNGAMYEWYVYAKL